jgi:hypothetical protein
LKYFARFNDEGQCKQLINRVTGVLLSLKHCEQLLPPNCWLVLGKAIFGKRPNPSERRSQFVGDISCKFALALYSPRDPKQ